MDNAILPVRSRDDCEFRSVRSGEVRFPLHRRICDGVPLSREFMVKHLDELRKLDYKGSTPLTLAVEKCNREAVALLLEVGADPNQIGRDGLSPLMLAAAGWTGDSAYARDVGPSLPGRKERSIAFDDILKLLIESGASVNYSDHRGLTAMDFARLNRRDSAREILRRHGGKEGDWQALHEPPMVPR